MPAAGSRAGGLVATYLISAASSRSDLAYRLMILGDVVGTRYAATWDPADLDEVVASYRKSLDLTPAVGTLWEIQDDVAARVAAGFYRDLGPLGAARALHETVRAVRDEFPGTPSLWAAYLHAGV